MKNHEELLSLFINCTRLKFIKDKDTSKILESIWNDRYVSKYMAIQAKRLSQLNPELGYDELLNDIKTNLYLFIINEFDINSSPLKVRSWIFAMIKWRILNQIRKEIGLNYSQEDKKYSKIELLCIDDNIEEALKQKDSVPKVRGDKGGAGSQNPYINLEFTIRKAKITSDEKLLLLFHYVFGYSLEDIAEIYGYSINYLRDKLFKAVDAFSKSLEKTSLFSKDDIFSLLNPRDSRK